ncbi:MAG: hypothetical protein V8S35_10715 [Lachnospira sp.]
MDIKLVKNFEEGNYIPVNEQLLLQVVDANYRLGRFPGKKIFMLNPLTNERLEILPEIHKYNLANISYAAVSHNHILFTSASSINETQVEISYYRYDVSTGAYHIIHTTVADLTKLGNVLLLKAFVLDENYCIFDEITYSRENLSSTGLFSNGMGTHKMLLKEIQENKERLLKDSVIATSGIEKLIPLSGNLCIIKLGSPMLEELVFSDTAIQPFKQKEIIGIVNIKQFISELLLNQNNAFLEILDEGSEEITFPYIRQYDNDIVYSKVDVSKKIEEVIIYDYETKVKKVRLNSNITRISDLNHTYILNDTPYIIKNTDKNTRLINLNTQKTDIKLSGDVRIKFIRRDLIVTQHHVKKMFFMRKENYYIEVFRYPICTIPFLRRVQNIKTVSHFLTIY